MEVSIFKGRQGRPSGHANLKENKEFKLLEKELKYVAILGTKCFNMV
jgi:hypothetical protein